MSMQSSVKLRFERWFTRTDVDARSRSRERAVATYFPQWKDLPLRAFETELYWVQIPQGSPVTATEVEEAATAEVLHALFMETRTDRAANPVDNGGFSASAAGKVWWCLEKRLRPGVTDNGGAVFREALELVLGDDTRRGGPLLTAVGARLWLELPAQTPRKEVQRYADQVFHNALIETVALYTAEEAAEAAERTPPALLGPTDGAALLPFEEAVSTVPLRGLAVDALNSLSRDRLWALSEAEMLIVQKHFDGLRRDPTDVEIEVIAQTWSEHCKHKIFAANIDVENRRTDVTLPPRVQSVFKTYIKGATTEAQRPFLESVFHDNAGVIALTDKLSLAVKVETHNSPSALDPYGGALTGIVGVNRDILGVGLGAAPVANLDVFCVGGLDAREELPPRLHHPRRILEGVRVGVEHGGNKSGIPTITGAVVHHPGYLGKPLVFCGTLGIIPRGTGRDFLKKEILSGDLIVMVGGRIGKDGIHGATFSSLEMNETSPVSAVQLGDPLTQRRVWDFLIEARDRGLFRAVTDNGAGGLSSSIGELARLCGTRGGARMDASLARTKYPGLKAFELTVSESQERMSFAVDPAHRDELEVLAESRGVECSFLGTFEDSGQFEVLYGGRTVANLDLHFLHEGLPALELKAEVVPPRANPVGYGIAAETRAARGRLTDGELLTAVAAHANVRSRRAMAQAYDHEVQARTVRKPYGTLNHASPCDGGVLRLGDDSFEGVAVGLGLAPAVAPFDARTAAFLALDEAVRNAVASGADPRHMALIDNFCWPDPLPGPGNPDAKEKLGALVVSSHALYESAVALGMPFISGKDSMKNDYRMGDVKISVPPTVLVTAVGKVQDVRALPAAQLTAAAVGQRVLFIAARPPVAGPCGFPTYDPKVAAAFYTSVHGLIAKGLVRALHDVSDGGWPMAVAEMLFGGDAGVRLKAGTLDPWFEPAASFVMAIAADDEAAVIQALKGHWVHAGGEVIAEPRLHMAWTDPKTGAVGNLDVAVADVAKAYFSAEPWHREPALTASAPPITAPTPEDARAKSVARTLRFAPHAPKAIVLAGDGINCQDETAAACLDGGFAPRIVHVNDLLRHPTALKDARLLVFPGGFSFGDELGSGQILALKFRHGLSEALQNHIGSGGLVLGICNGFQVLTRLGLFGNEVTLAPNSGGSYLNRWVGLTLTGESAFTYDWKRRGISRLEVPMRHGEGRLLFANEALAQSAWDSGQCVFQYDADVNGAWNRVAGLSSHGGRVLGLMPHPEAFWSAELHPWGETRPVPLGTVLFETAFRKGRES
jgi:phosphoribosylformylglycinamidine synthase